MMLPLPMPPESKVQGHAGFALAADAFLKLFPKENYCDASDPRMVILFDLIDKAAAVTHAQWLDAAPAAKASADPTDTEIFDITDASNRYAPCPKCSTTVGMRPVTKKGKLAVQCGYCGFRGVEVAFEDVCTSDHDKAAFDGWNLQAMIAAETPTPEHLAMVEKFAVQKAISKLPSSVESDSEPDEPVVQEVNRG